WVSAGSMCAGGGSSPVEAPPAQAGPRSPFARAAARDRRPPADGRCGPVHSLVARQLVARQMRRCWGAWSVPPAAQGGCRHGSGEWAMAHQPMLIFQRPTMAEQHYTRDGRVMTAQCSVDVSLREETAQKYP